MINVVREMPVFRSLPQILFVVAVAVVVAIGPSRGQEAPSEAGQRLTRLQGTAMIDRRERVIGAVVMVRPEDGVARIYLTSTDEDGDFLLDAMPEGLYSLTLARSGYETVVKTAVALKFPFRAVVELTMQRSDDVVPVVTRGDVSAEASAVSISGIMSDRQGNPLSEARIRFVHPEGTADPRYVQTGTDGSFVVGDLASGVWEVEVDGVGYLPIDVDLAFTEDTEMDLRMVRQPADYEPSPFELMPPEKPTPPPGFEPRIYKDDVTGEANQDPTLDARTAK